MLHNSRFGISWLLRENASENLLNGSCNWSRLAKPLGQRRFLLTVARLGKRYQETLFAGEASKTRENRHAGWNSGIKGRNGNEKRSEGKQAYAWLAKVGWHRVERRNKNKKVKKWRIGRGEGEEDEEDDEEGRRNRWVRRRSGSIMSRT